MDRLRKASIQNMGNGIIEIIVDEGAEISVFDLDELYEYFRKADPPARLSLIDRKNRYSFTLNAVMKASFETDVIDACAEVCYGRNIWGNLLNKFAPKNFSLRSFNTREEAIEWLLKKNNAGQKSQTAGVAG